MDHAETLLLEAEEQIEAWWCELDGRWHQVMADAAQQSAHVMAAAESEAQRVIAAAQTDAGSLLAAARREAEVTLETARLDAEAVGALAAAEAVVARGVAPDDLEALRHAIDRLRTELSRVVDAAFDALPAIEATAEAVDQIADPEPEPELVEAGPAPKRRRFRLFRRG